MKRHFLTLLLVIFSNFIYSQKGEAVLILKDSTKINGIGEISGLSSIVTIKFRNDTLKYKTYNSKEIIGIDIFENDFPRKFRYKYVDGKKFPEIVEIVSIDNLSLYIKIYEGGTLSSFPSFNQNNISNGINNPLQNKIKLPSGQEISTNQSQNSYLMIDFPRYSYFVGIGVSNQIKSLYTKGLPFSKSFKNSMKDFFKDCPELLEKVENKEFTNDNLLEVLNFYNTECLKKEQN